jgi:putative ABC transport system permease protein
MEDVKADYGVTKFSDDNAKEAIISIASLKNMNLTDPNKVLNTELNFEVVQVDESGNSKKEGNILKLKVVGISKEENTKFCYVPISLINNLDAKVYNSTKIRVAKREDMAEVRKTVESMGYPTTSVKDTVDQINQIFTIIKGILGGFGLIALFVAAIGIFNTLTISLLERTHEIGIMKAIGGRDRDVARIFTIEASLIGLIGGFLGVGTGWLFGKGLNWIVNFIATSVGGEANSLFLTPISFAGMVIAFSFFVSTFAGVWPARRAAKLDPLEALRYE